MLKLFFLSLLLCAPLLICYGQNYTISGYVKEIGSQETLLGVAVSVPNLKIGTASNNYGFYSLTIPASKDSIELIFTTAGYQAVNKKLLLQHNTELDILMK